MLNGHAHVLAALLRFFGDEQRHITFSFTVFPLDLVKERVVRVSLTLLRVDFDEAEVLQPDVHGAEAPVVASRHTLAAKQERSALLQRLPRVVLLCLFRSSRTLCGLRMAVACAQAVFAFRYTFHENTSSRMSHSNSIAASTPNT